MVQIFDNLELLLKMINGIKILEGAIVEKLQYLGKVKEKATCKIKNRIFEIENIE